MELPTDIVPISSTADDAQLISSILDGHTEHFRLLTERYALDVKRIVGRMIPQAEDAEDVIQIMQPKCRFGKMTESPRR